MVQSTAAASLIGETFPKAGSIDHELYDDPEFNRDFVERKGGEVCVRILVSGMKCFACSKRIRETLVNNNPSLTVEINLSEESAELRFPAGKISIGSLVDAIEKMGFSVSPARGESGRHRRHLMRIGAGFLVMMNVMAFAAAEYVGGEMEHGLWQMFRWLSAGLTTVSVFYVGYPMLASALFQARRLRVTVDQPIGFAMLAGYFWSMVNTFRGEGEVYFDSVAAVIALLVAGRYLQARTIERALRASQGSEEASNDFVRVLREDGKIEHLRLPQVKIGQKFMVRPGDSVPVTSRLTSLRSEFSLEQISGELNFSPYGQGMIVPSGARCGRHAGELIAIENGAASYVQKIQDSSRQLLTSKGQISHWSDKATSVFFAGVLVLSAACLAYWWHVSPEVAIKNTIAIMMVACPCALAIASPLTYTKSLAMALQGGVAFKSQRAIELLATTKNWVFDKTGTLTEIATKIVDFHYFDESLIHSASWWNFARVIDRYSLHHVPSALSRWANQKFGDGLASFLPMENDLHASGGQDPIEVEEYPGKGLIARVDGHEWRIGKLDFVANDSPNSDQYRHWNCRNWSFFVGDGARVLAAFSLEEVLVQDATEAIREISGAKIQTMLLSGDKVENTRRVADSLGIEEIAGNASPEDKMAILRRWSGGKPVLMVGNGLNDLLALSDVTLAATVANACDSSRNAADIHLTRYGIMPLIRARWIAIGAMAAIRRSFAFAATYNFIGLALACAGYVSPVVAAIAMPINAAVVSYLATHWRVPEK